MDAKIGRGDKEERTGSAPQHALRKGLAIRPTLV